MKCIPLFVCITCIFIHASLSSPDVVRKFPGKKFNVCRRMSYYAYGATNPFECWYNPDVDSYAHDIIKRYGYSFEYYKITSEDNYITTLFRIPSGKDQSNDTNNRQPVFLLHGLATSAHNMVDIGKKCLAFALADAGYDVWLGNMRGNSYSLGHTNMTYKNPQYWKFSFHEIGKYDMPATLKLISKNTNGKKVIFIGHSLAASVFHVFEAHHRQLAKQYLSGAILIAPMVYLANIQPVLPELESFGNSLMILATLMGVKNNSTDAQQVLSYKRFLCQEVPAMLHSCNNGLFLAFGLRSANIPPHYIPLMLAHNPSGFSVTTFNHLLQISRNDGTFQEYDYGVAINQQIYNDVFPPEYDVKGCEIPVYIFYGAGDWISNEWDVLKLLKTIPGDKIKGSYKINAESWNHFDYFYGKYSTSLFYTPLLEALQKFKCDKASQNNEYSSTTESSHQETPFPIPSSKSKAASISNLDTFGTPPTVFSTSRIIRKTTSKAIISSSSPTFARSRTFNTTPIVCSTSTKMTSKATNIKKVVTTTSLPTFDTSPTALSTSLLITKTITKPTSINTFEPPPSMFPIPTEYRKMDLMPLVPISKIPQVPNENDIAVMSESRPQKW